MGNTLPLIETASDAISYQNSIKRLGVLFEPIMTIMLTQSTTPEMIFEAAQKGIRFVKFIPIGTSTGAIKGLRIDDFEKLYEIFPAIIENGMHLLLHAELMFERSGREISLLEREVKAISVISMFHFKFPKMKITIEHASTVNMIGFVKLCDSENIRATLTPHHALLSYSDVFDQEGRIINPFNYCLPVLKREVDRQAVVEAMVSGDERFFAGTDAAPHWALSKTGENPPAGIFFGSSEYLRYLEVFEREKAMNRFENFTSRFGAEYYGYSLNEENITVAQNDWVQPEGEHRVGFCMGGEKLRWKIIKRREKQLFINFLL
jgi:dihydroorotase